jgi:hypothetical protein
MFRALALMLLLCVLAFHARIFLITATVITCALVRATECFPLKNGNQYLRADFRIRCDDDASTYELFGLPGAPELTYKEYRSLAKLMIILYPIGVIVLFVGVLRRHAKSLYDDTLLVDLDSGRLVEDVPVTKVDLTGDLKPGDKVYVDGESARGTVKRVNKAFDMWYIIQKDEDKAAEGMSAEARCCASKDSCGKAQKCRAKARGHVNARDEFGEPGCRCYFHKGRRTCVRKERLRSQLIDERFFLKRWWSHLANGHRFLPAGTPASFATGGDYRPSMGSEHSCCAQRKPDLEKCFVVQRLQRSDHFPVNGAMMNRFGSLYAGYTAKCYWWESMELFRKLTLTGLIIFIKPGSAAQLAMGCVISLFFTVMYARLTPYSDPDDDMLQLLCNLVIFANFFFGLLLKMQVGENDDAFSTLIFAMQLVPLVLGCCIVFYFSFGRYFMLKKKLASIYENSTVKHRSLLEKLGTDLKLWHKLQCKQNAQPCLEANPLQANPLHRTAGGADEEQRKRLGIALRQAKNRVYMGVKELQKALDPAVDQPGAGGSGEQNILLGATHVIRTHSSHGENLVAAMLEQQCLPVRVRNTDLSAAGDDWEDKTFREICEDEVFTKEGFDRFLRTGEMPDDYVEPREQRGFSAGTIAQLRAWQRDSDDLDDALPVRRESPTGAWKPVQLLVHHDSTEEDSTHTVI